MNNVHFFKENDLVPEWIIAESNDSYFKQDATVVILNGCNYFISATYKYLMSYDDTHSCVIKLNQPKDGCNIIIHKFGELESLLNWAKKGMELTP